MNTVTTPFRLIALATAVAPLLGAANGVLAQSAGESHEHGVAELTLAMSSSNLQINFEIPGANILGFEHKATTPSQLAAVEAAEAKLRNTQGLFTFTGTQCTVEKVVISFLSTLDDASTEPVTNDHHEEHEGSHAHVAARYDYSCLDSAHLASLQVGLSELPFGLHAIQTQWVNDSDQGAATLTAGKRRLIFR